MLRPILQDGSVERACESLRGGGLMGDPQVTRGVPWKGTVGPWSPPPLCFLADEGVVLFCHMFPPQSVTSSEATGLESPNL